jgi:hypothetical protein
MTRHIVAILAAATVALGTTPAHAALSTPQQQQILDEARQAYDGGVAALRTDPIGAAQLFADSARRFEQLVADGVVNGQLQYNLGNAYLQLGELGRAILHYRAAEQITPRDPKLRHNLKYARSLTESRIAVSGERALRTALLGWHQSTSIRTRFVVFVTAYTLCWVLLTVNLFASRPWWRWPAVAAGVVWIAMGISVASDTFGAGDSREGVVLIDDVVVRKGNSEGFDPQFEQPLHQGVEFRVIEQRPGWLSIELPDGKTGWIRATDAGLF